MTQTKWPPENRARFNRVAFIRDGLLTLRDRIVAGIDVGRAARALREAATWLGVDRLVVPAWRLLDAHGHRLARSAAPQARALIAQVGQRLGHTTPSSYRTRERGIER